MELEAALKALVANAGPIGGVVGSAIIIGGLLLRGRGPSNVVQAPTVDASKLAEVSDGLSTIDAKLDAVERRLGNVEHDVTTRATREEMHRLELSFTRLEGEMKSQGMTIQSTAHAVGRIEDHIVNAALRQKSA